MYFILHTLLFLTICVSLVQGQISSKNNQKSVGYDLHLCSVEKIKLKSGKTGAINNFNLKLESKKALVESNKNRLKELNRYIEALENARVEKCKQAYSFREENAIIFNQLLNVLNISQSMDVVQNINHVLAAELIQLHLNFVDFNYASKYWLLSLKALFAGADRDATIEIAYAITDDVDMHLNQSKGLEFSVEEAFNLVIQKCTHDQINNKSEIQKEWNQLTQAIDSFVDARVQLMQSFYNDYIRLENTIPVIAPDTTTNAEIENAAQQL